MFVGEAEPEPAADDIERTLVGEGLQGCHQWGNAPGDTYGWHRHDYHKVLYCLSGGITFHTHDGDVALTPGDRLDLAPGTDHAATVGPSGVRCIEAMRPA